jgi:hypothetical protein
LGCQRAVCSAVHQAPQALQQAMGVRAVAAVGQATRGVLGLTMTMT